MIKAFQRQRKENEARRAKERKEDIMFDEKRFQKFLSGSRLLEKF